MIEIQNLFSRTSLSSYNILYDTAENSFPIDGSASPDVSNLASLPQHLNFLFFYVLLSPFVPRFSITISSSDVSLSYCATCITSIFFIFVYSQLVCKEKYQHLMVQADHKQTISFIFQKTTIYRNDLAKKQQHWEENMIRRENT